MGSTVNNGRRRHPPQYLLLLLALCLPSASSVRACLYNVRDLGFTDLGDRPYVLNVYWPAEQSAPEAGLLHTTCAAALDQSNVTASVVPTGTEADPSAMELLRFWDLIPPAAVLVEPEGRSLALPFPGDPVGGTSQAFSDAQVDALLERVATSPLRTRMLEHLASAYALVLVLEGPDDRANSRACELATEAVATIEERMPQLPKRIDEPPQILRLPCGERAQERVLLWSLGATEVAAAETQVAVVYGRGRRVGPLLGQKELSTARLEELLTVVGLSCECTLERDWIRGQALPMRWDRQSRQRAARLLGFDPDNPLVKAEMAHILAMPAGAGAGSAGDDPLEAYGEGPLTRTHSARARRLSPAALQQLVAGSDATPPASPPRGKADVPAVAAAAAPGDRETTTPNRSLAWTLAILVCGALIGTGMVLLRARRQP